MQNGGQARYVGVPAAFFILPAVFRSNVRAASASRVGGWLALST
jgi:hypothetical protein